LLLLLILVGCAASKGPMRLADLSELHPKIAVSQIPAVNIAGADLETNYKPQVSLGKISDERLQPTLIEFNGKKIAGRGDVTLVVDYVLKKALRLRGISLDQNAPLILETTVTRWRAETGNRSVSAEAVVRAELIGPGGENVYTGLYEGFSEQPSEEFYVRDVQTALGAAMHQALTNLIQDGRMLEFLSAY
jgi:hypothetical protein